MYALFSGCPSDIFVEGCGTMSAFLSCKDFCGESNTEKQRQSLRKLFELAVDLRGRLKRQGYLIDTHLRMLMSVTETIPLNMVSEDGFHATSELRGIIRYALWGEGTGGEHPLYEKAKEYIDKHAIPQQERPTQMALYFTALFEDFMEYKAQEYLSELEEHIRMDAPFDPIRLQENRRRLCDMLGSEADIERLEILFRESFLPVAPIDSFTQGLTYALLSELLLHDEESSRLIFQLALDNRPDNTV